MESVVPSVNLIETLVMNEVSRSTANFNSGSPRGPCWSSVKTIASQGHECPDPEVMVLNTGQVELKTHSSCV